MKNLTAALALVLAASAFSAPHRWDDRRQASRGESWQEWRGFHARQEREAFERQRLEQELIRMELERERWRMAREHQRRRMERHEAWREPPRCERMVDVVEVPVQQVPRARVEINWP